MRTWLATAALVVATLAVFELLCRWFIGFAPRERFDPRYDRLPRPDQPTVQSHEGFSHARTNELGFEQEVQDKVTCCFAVQDKTWVKGPENDWEFYTVLDDAPTMSCGPEDPCCAVDA